MTDKCSTNLSYGTDENTFIITVGRTVYEVTTHFNPFGRETVLEQLKSLLLELNMV